MKYLRYSVIALFIAVMGFTAFSVSSHLLLPMAYNVPKARPAPMIVPGEPVGGGDALPKPAPTPPQAKVEIPGFLSIAISEENSWATIAKLMVIILGTFLGIRAINAVFSKLVPAS